MHHSASLGSVYMNVYYGENRHLHLSIAILSLIFIPLGLKLYGHTQNTDTVSGARQIFYITLFRLVFHFLTRMVAFPVAAFYVFQDVEDIFTKTIIISVVIIFTIFNIWAFLVSQYLRIGKYSKIIKDIENSESEK